MKKIFEQKRYIQILILILACMSFYIASRDSLFYRNMTYVGNQNEYRLLFITWGILQSLFFTMMTYLVLQKYDCKNSFLWYLTLFDMGVNILAYLLPYHHPGGDFISQMHVFLSFISSLLAGIILLLIIKEIIYKNIILFHKCKNIAIFLITIILFLATVLGDFTGIMEIVFLNGVSYLLYTMLYNE